MVPISTSPSDTDNLFIIGPGTFLDSASTRAQMAIPDWMLTPWEKEDWRNDPDLGHWEAEHPRPKCCKRARVP